MLLCEMASELDASIAKLIVEQNRLQDKLGDLRVDELREYWLKLLPSEEEEAFRLGMDHDDKKLVWVWLRLKVLFSSRAKAGHALMRDCFN